MKQNQQTVDPIIARLRRAYAELGKGKNVPEICKLPASTDRTDYCWYQKYDRTCDGILRSVRYQSVGCTVHCVVFPPLFACVDVPVCKSPNFPNSNNRYNQKWLAARAIGTD